MASVKCTVAYLGLAEGGTAIYIVLAMDSKTKELKRIPMLADCSNKELEVLASHMDELSFPADYTLINEGQGNHTFYVLTSGKAEVVIQGELKATLGPGDFFGEISMQERTLATASVRTTTPVMALVMSHDQFRAIRGNPQVSERVTRILTERLAADRLSPSS